MAHCDHRVLPEVAPGVAPMLRPDAGHERAAGVVGMVRGLRRDLVFDGSATGNAIFHAAVLGDTRFV
jgi:hypothetical protein